MAGKKKSDAVPFEDQLVLFHWFLHLLEVDAWNKLPLDELKKAEDDVSTVSPSPFAEVLKRWNLAATRITGQELDRYDARVVEVTEKLNEKRGQTPLRWKYFQYLGLLFTEIYLDRFFRDREKLRTDLNAWVKSFNAKHGTDLPPYEVDVDKGDDLAKLAFWQATGSGKTLLLHAHLHQFRAACLRHSKKLPKNTLLITPNDGLSRQHIEEFGASGIPAHKYARQTVLGTSNGITVIEITSFADKEGPETIKVDRFEGDNLVFVDEGHRGGSATEEGKWRQRRQALAKNGFCFEYSATLAQVAEKNTDLLRDYARSIAIDYAYKKFHGDGYGKHYRILNLKEGEQRDQTDYFTGALVTLFQQAWVWRKNGALASTFGLEAPLALFVGASVTGGKESNAEQTDILAVLEFLGRFVKERRQTEARLKALLDSRGGLNTRKGYDIFDRNTVFPEIPKEWKADHLYDKMLELLFNASAPGLLHIHELKEADGELALSVGEGDPFAVVNVGDAAGVRELCEDKQYQGLFDVREKGFKGSLFEGLNRPGSTVSFLIGSRKFMEGWSSWRVSLMGLLHLGKSAGTQIIQLFGRGVRLRGKDQSLKRASTVDAFADPGTENSRLRVMETLGVFGVKADYMKQFDEELRKAGLDPDEDKKAPANVEKLPVVRVKDIPHLPVVMEPPTRFPQSSEWLPIEVDLGKVKKVERDFTPIVEIQDDGGVKGVLAESDRHAALPCLAFVDHHRLYGDLLRLKNAKGWTNLALPRFIDTAEGPIHLTQWLLNQPGWYEVIIPQRYVAPDSLAHLALWQEIASTLLSDYLAYFYKQRERRYMTLHSKVVWLDKLPEEQQKKFFPQEYTIDIYGDDPVHTKQLVAFIKALALKVKLKQFDDEHKGYIVSMGLAQHLYNPLLFQPAKKQVVKVNMRPVALNDGERNFVDDLKRYLATSPPLLEEAEVYLLRNEAKIGSGFYEKGGYFPDFMLWVKKKDRLWLTFVDPKGLRNLLQGEAEPKVSLWKTLQEIEQQQKLTVKLDAWLVSGTTQMEAPVSLKPFDQNHIVFQEDPKHIEKMLTAVLSRT